MAESRPQALAIVGATASGKSALALALADALDGEIISMDSRQVYRGMDVGTAKPTSDEQRRVPHHGLDLINPGERYSAGQFARDARQWIRDIEMRGRTPIVAGGTLFFLRALQQPLFDEPEMNAEVRESLRTYLNALDLDVLRQWAGYVAEEPLPVDRQRLARLVEIATLTGRCLSDWHSITDPEPGIRTVTFVMSLDRSELYRRIDQRVHDMVANGFVREVQALVASGYGSEDPGMNATGYGALLPYLEGERSLDEAIKLIQAATRQYARRQLTWIRTQLGQDVHVLDAKRPLSELVERVTEVWRMERS